MRYGLALAVIILFLGTLSCKRKPVENGEMIDTANIPSSEFFGPTELALNEGKEKRWRLLTTHITRYNQNKRIMMDPLTVYIYSEGEKDSSTLTADSGETTDDLNRLIARGHVVIRTLDGKCLKTEEIHFDKATEQISSSKLVRLSTREGDVISGVGFEADKGMNRWKIKNRVKAKIQQVEKKAEKLP
jgi:LPS export ABC transporter protein LptC